MRLGFQQNDLDSSAGRSLSGSFRKTGSGLVQNDLSPGQSLDGSFRKSRTGFHQSDQDMSSAPSLDGSFRKSKTGLCKATSGSTKFVPISKQAYKALKYYAKNLLDIELFTRGLEDWILKNSLTDSNNGDNHSFNSLFQIDELQELDFALEGTLFQQLFRMPCSFYSNTDLKEEYFTLEDFIHAMASGLWRTFWHKSKPSPFFVASARNPRSRFYPVEIAIARGKLRELSGAALILSIEDDPHVQWDRIVQFALFKPDIMLGNKQGISSTALCEAVFYGFHILISRRLSKHCSINSDSVFVLVLDSKFGAVVKFSGNLHQLELDSDDPYEAVAEWIKVHSEISVSPVERIWNKLGNANWGDLGTLQLMLATFYSIVQCVGPARKSIASVASDHSFRLQKRRIERNLTENEDRFLPSEQHYTEQHGEIVLENNGHYQAFRNQASRLILHRGDIIQVDDQQQGERSFRVQDTLINGSNSICYTAVSLENPTQLYTLYVGAHPSRLEPSWEDMGLWYQVQRQTKVLNVLRQAGISSRYLPEIVSSGRILHLGPCQKQSPMERCDHPWCGTPVLLTLPVGDSLSSVLAHDGLLSSEELVRCCRDCLAALRSARLANVQHGDISPDTIIRVGDPHINSSSTIFYVLISWGRAVLEERDSPTVNLSFSSSHALQHGKLCPSSDVESLVYLIYYLCGGSMQEQQDSIESALNWRQKCWAKRLIQRQLGEVSTILKAFADYVDSLCGTPYPVDYDGWLKRLDKALNEASDRGKFVEEMAVAMRFGDVAGSSGGSEVSGA